MNTDGRTQAERDQAAQNVPKTWWEWFLAWLSAPVPCSLITWPQRGPEPPR